MLKVAIIGNNQRVVNNIYYEFIENNMESILFCSKDKVILKDGTEIFKMDLQIPYITIGKSFDQVMYSIDDDFNSAIPENIYDVGYMLSRSCVPSAYRFLIWE